jgi:hypothetical protein
MQSSQVALKDNDPGRLSGQVFLGDLGDSVVFAVDVCFLHGNFFETLS